MSQAPAHYGMQTMTAVTKIQGGYRLEGLCYRDGYLYTVERWQDEIPVYRSGYSLVVYRVQNNSGYITMLDRLEIDTGVLEVSVCPRVDRDSRRVFVPCIGCGVTVAYLECDRLVRQKTLTCVRDVVSVDVMSADTIYVCDYDSASVRVVDVRRDKVTSTLNTPFIMRGELPITLAVLRDIIMVGYTAQTVVFYRQGIRAPFKTIHRLPRLQSVSAVSTDCLGYFIVTALKSVFVMDVTGNLLHTVNIDTDDLAQDSTVVNGHLWVGCANGSIAVTSWITGQLDYGDISPHSSSYGLYRFVLSE